MTDMFDIDSAALEEAMRGRWGKPAEIEGILPLAELPPEPEEPEELDLGLGSNDDDDDDDDNEPTEPVVTEPGVEPPATSTAPPAPTVDPDLIPIGDGRYLSRAQVEYYAGVDARLGQDAGFREYVANYGKAPPAPPKPTTPPPELDLDDPNVKFLWDRLQEQERRLAQTGQVVTLTQAQQQQELESRTTALVNRAAASFQAEHELTDDQMKELRTSAANMGCVNTYMNGRNPITNQPVVNPDIMGAIDTALTVAFRARDDFIKESQEKVTRRQLDNKTRKKNLNKIGGNSGSAPRTPPAIPADPKGRREAFLAEVTTIMNGQQG